MENNNKDLKKHLGKISDFVDSADLDSAREQLVDMLYAAMNSQYMEDMGLEVRSDLVHFYILLLNLIEGIHWLALPILEKFEYPLPPVLTAFKHQCPYCTNPLH